ncbi:MAG: hypothetical protein ACRELU_03990 [Gemmatimonadota bacterium]
MATDPVQFAPTLTRALAAVLLVIATAACEESPIEVPADAAANEMIAAAAAAGAQTLDHRELCDPREHEFTLQIDNDFFPMPVGRTWFLEGREENDEGEIVKLRLKITVLDRVERVAGVRTRVVEEKEWEDGELIERSLNFFAQSEQGTLCYFGEEVFPASIGGAWRADNPDSHAGIYFPAHPVVGMTFLQEEAPNARDKSAILDLNRRVRTPYRVFRETLTARDCNQIEEPGCNPLTSDDEVKHYAEDVGIIVDGPVRLVHFLSGQGGLDD